MTENAAAANHLARAANLATDLLGELMALHTLHANVKIVGPEMVRAEIEKALARLAQLQRAMERARDHLG